jgi:hypothetical protein
MPPQLKEKFQKKSLISKKELTEKLGLELITKKKKN